MTTTAEFGIMKLESSESVDLRRVVAFAFSPGKS